MSGAGPSTDSSRPECDVIAPGRVVVLNGTSSSGKTSTANAFQELRAQAGELWVVLALDDYIGKVPRRWVEVGNWVGSFASDGIQLVRDGERATFRIGEQAQQLMPRVPPIGSRDRARGINVIVDEVSLQEHEWIDWCDALEGIEAVWVAIRCDTEVASRREAARGDRVIGLVRGQADVVHRFPAYDLELDTTATPLDEVVAPARRVRRKLGPADPGLDAPVGNQPHERHHHVERNRDPTVQERERDRHRVDDR